MGEFWKDAPSPKVYTYALTYRTSDGKETTMTATGTVHKLGQAPDNEIIYATFPLGTLVIPMKDFIKLEAKYE
jgi:hypothetical protein